jgi:hypothetical protein
MFFRLESDGTAPATPADAEHTLNNLELFNNGLKHEDCVKAIYWSAISTLRRTFELAALNRLNPGLALLWSAMLGRGYVDLLHSKGPRTNGPYHPSAFRCWTAYFQRILVPQRLGLSPRRGCAWGTG